MNIRQDRFACNIGKVQIQHFEGRLFLCLGLRQGNLLKPGPYLFLIRLQIHRLDMLRMILGRNLTSRMFERRHIQRLTDTLLNQNIGGKQLVRRHIRRNPSVPDHHNSVYIPVKGIL